MAIERNIAALLREDAKTIRVRFYESQYDKVRRENNSIANDTMETFTSQKVYSYVTDLELELGNMVVVEAAGQFKVALVVEVDDSVKVEPGHEYQLRWVVCRIDTTAYEQNMKRNKEIEELVQQAYQKNLRRSFAQQILAGVDDTARDNLQKLLGG